MLPNSAVLRRRRQRARRDTPCSDGRCRNGTGHCATQARGKYRPCSGFGERRVRGALGRSHGGNDGATGPCCVRSAGRSLVRHRRRARDDRECRQRTNPEPALRRSDPRASAPRTCCRRAAGTDRACWSTNASRVTYVAASKKSQSWQTRIGANPPIRPRRWRRNSKIAGRNRDVVLYQWVQEIRRRDTLVDAAAQRARIGVIQRSHRHRR